MTARDIEILDRINKYAEEKLGDIDPQKTQVSKQLSILMPKMQEIADELGISLEDMFSKYMDLQSDASLINEMKLREQLEL
jgi:DNA-directed RNA polymerase specialized sigma subunit